MSSQDENTFESLPVSGYKRQTLSAVIAVNENKAMEEHLLRRLDELRDYAEIDQRWLALGRTHIEQGFMAITRAIFKPERVRLPEDAEGR